MLLKFGLWVAVSLYLVSGCVAAKATYSGAVLAAKGLYYTGKGVYYLGSIPVKIADKALDVTATTLLLTYKVVDTAGDIATISTIIASKSLDAELAAIKQIPNVIEILVDVAS